MWERDQIVDYTHASTAVQTPFTLVHSAHRRRPGRPHCHQKNSRRSHRPLRRAAHVVGLAALRSVLMAAARVRRRVPRVAGVMRRLRKASRQCRAARSRLYLARCCRPSTSADHVGVAAAAVARLPRGLRDRRRRRGGVPAAGRLPARHDRSDRQRQFHRDADRPPQRHHAGTAELVGDAEARRRTARRRVPTCRWCTSPSQSPIANAVGCGLLACLVAQGGGGSFAPRRRTSGGRWPTARRPPSSADDSPAPVRHPAAAAAGGGVRAPELAEPLLLDRRMPSWRRLPAVPAVLPSTTAPGISFSAADVWRARRARCARAPPPCG